MGCFKLIADFIVTFPLSALTSSIQSPGPKAKPELKLASIIPPVSTGKNKLTRQLFDQIPFLENDPLKSLEMLKKMVQESGMREVSCLKLWSL